MSSVQESRSVAVDEPGVRPWEEGGTEYVAPLTGAIDDAWVESFVLIRSRSARFSRFHLNRARSRVTFNCRSGDQESQLLVIVENLKMLVAQANRWASPRDADSDETEPLRPSADEADAPQAPEEATRAAPDEEPLREVTGRFVSAIAYSLSLLESQSTSRTALAALAHLMGTASLVIEDGGSEDEAIAALFPLGDMGLSTPDSAFDEIAGRFGERVGALVRTCEEAQGALAPAGDPRLYSLYFRHSAAPVRRIVCASKLKSARSLLASFRRLEFAKRLGFRDAHDRTLNYYRRLVEGVLEAGHSSHLIQELDGVVLEMELAAGPISAERRQKRPIDRLTDEVVQKVDLQFED